MLYKIVKKSVIQPSKDTLGGETVFRGARVPVQTLIEHIEAGDSLNDFLHDYPSVTKKQIISVLELVKKGVARGRGSSLTNRFLKDLRKSFVIIQ